AGEPAHEPRRQPGSGPLRLRGSASDGTGDAKAREHLRALRALRRALSHRGLGHAKVDRPPTLRWKRYMPEAHPRVNDFAFKLANVNGTGSASANGLLMQAIFRMGIPVSGKNLFPSNIQGLPTWYEIRVNKDGRTARALDYDLIVAMNAQTYARDVKEVRSGGYLLFDSTWPLDKSLHRPDVVFLGVPFAQLCVENSKEPRERILMKNIAYAGSLIALLDIEMSVVE